MTHAREITTPVDLCNDRGHLSPEALGWSPGPLHRTSLRGSGRVVGDDRAPRERVGIRGSAEEARNRW